jgi:hypothetical protein
MEPTSTSHRPAHDTALTEAQFLQQEANDAKAALVAALGQLKSQVAAGVDPRGLVKDHPWLTLSGVAAASFVATTVAVPSKEQQALRKLAAIEAAIHRSAPEAAKRNGHGEGKAPRSLLGIVLVELLGAFKPLIGELFANFMHPPHEPDEHTPHAG